MLEISTGDFREQIELAGIQGNDAADMLSICLLGYRTMDLGRKKNNKFDWGIVANPSPFLCIRKYLGLGCLKNEVCTHGQ